MPAQGLLIEIPGAGDADQVPAREEPPPFRLIRDEGRLAVAGTVDTFGADRLAQLLASSPVVGPAVTLDLRRMEFVDVAGCRAIAAWACDLREHSAQLTLVGASRLVQRMWQLLALAEVAPVTFAEQAA